MATQSELEDVRWNLKVLTARMREPRLTADKRTILRAEYNTIARQYNRDKKWFNKEIKRV